MSDLPPCDREIFEQGTSLLAADTGMQYDDAWNRVEDCGAGGFDVWVRDLAAISGQRIDWHYSGGIAHVLYIGDRAQIEKATQRLPCPARIMRWFADEEPGLYRAGVTPMPKGAIAGWYEGGSGSVFAIKPEEPGEGTTS